MTPRAARASGPTPHVTETKPHNEPGRPHTTGGMVTPQNRTLAMETSWSAATRQTQSTDCEGAQRLSLRGSSPEDVRIARSSSVAIAAPQTRFWPSSRQQVVESWTRVVSTSAECCGDHPVQLTHVQLAARRLHALHEARGLATVVPLPDIRPSTVHHPLWIALERRGPCQQQARCRCCASVRRTRTSGRGRHATSTAVDEARCRAHLVGRPDRGRCPMVVVDRLRPLHTRPTRSPSVINEQRIATTHRPAA